MEAAGSPELSVEAIGALAANGVLCLRGITGQTAIIPLDARLLNGELVLHNKAVFGSTNAASEDWQQAVRDLEAIAGRWPDALDGMMDVPSHPTATRTRSPPPTA